MPNLNLDHALPVSQHEIILVLGAMFGLALAAMLVLAFTRRWLGLVAGLLILACTLGIGGYEGYTAYHSFDTKGIRARNVATLSAAVKQTYAVQLTSTQAKALLVGTDAYQPKQGVTSKFGTVKLTVRDVVNNTEAVPQQVSLVWQRSRWALLIIQPDASYSEVQHARK